VFLLWTLTIVTVGLNAAKNTYEDVTVTDPTNWMFLPALYCVCAVFLSRTGTVSVVVTDFVGCLVLPFVVNTSFFAVRKFLFFHCVMDVLLLLASIIHFRDKLQLYYSAQGISDPEAHMENGLGRWLVRPHDAVSDRILRRRTRILSLCLLILIPANILWCISEFRTNADTSVIGLSAAYLVTILILYAMSRSPLYKWASRATLAAFLLFPYFFSFCPSTIPEGAMFANLLANSAAAVLGIALLAGEDLITLAAIIFFPTIYSPLFPPHIAMSVMLLAAALISRDEHEELVSSGDTVAEIPEDDASNQKMYFGGRFTYLQAARYSFLAGFLCCFILGMTPLIATLDSSRPEIVYSKASLTSEAAANYRMFVTVGHCPSELPQQYAIIGSSARLYFTYPGSLVENSVNIINLAVNPKLGGLQMVSVTLGDGDWKLGQSEYCDIANLQILDVATGLSVATSILPPLESPSSTTQSHQFALQDAGKKSKSDDDQNSGCGTVTAGRNSFASTSATCPIVTQALSAVIALVCFLEPCSHRGRCAAVRSDDEDDACSHGGVSFSFYKPMCVCNDGYTGPRCEHTWKEVCPVLSFRTCDGTCDLLTDPSQGQMNQLFPRDSPPRYADSVGAVVNPVPSRQISPHIYGQKDPLWSLYQPKNDQTVWASAFLNYVLTDIADFRGSYCSLNSYTLPNDKPPFVIYREPFVGGFSNKDPYAVPAVCADSYCSCQPTTCSKLNNQTMLYPRSYYNAQTPSFDGSATYGVGPGLCSSWQSNSGGEFTFGKSKLFQKNNNGVPMAHGHNDPKSMFVIGDYRANTDPLTLALHTMVMRNHNRIVASLKSCMKKSVSGTVLFNSARLVNVAQLHQVLKELLESFGFDSSEAARCPPNNALTVSLETALFMNWFDGRPDKVATASSCEDLKTYPTLDAAFNTSFFESQGIDKIVQGALRQPVTPGFSSNWSDFDGTKLGRPESRTDIVASLIELARDLGLGTYNQVRQAYCLQPVTCEPGSSFGACSLYGDASQIELAVGMLYDDGSLARRIFLGALNRLVANDRFQTDLFQKQLGQTTALNALGANDCLLLELQDLSTWKFKSLIMQTTNVPNIQPSAFKMSVGNNWNFCQGNSDTFPTSSPTTASPTRSPTVTPTAAPVTRTPTRAGETYSPTASPSAAPSGAPTAAPSTAAPSAAPTRAPSTGAPTVSPTVAPTAAPTTAPTAAPTTAPTVAPTVAPTAAPTAAPTVAPTAAPTTTAPTAAPTAAPTTVAPTAAPSTAAPTTTPTGAPSTAAPTVAPTAAPTAAPTSAPTTVAPTGAPTSAPTTAAPTAAPTSAPTTVAPSAAPTGAPTTGAPSAAPTRVPSAAPTASPTASPTMPPTILCAKAYAYDGSCNIYNNRNVNLISAAPDGSLPAVAGLSNVLFASGVDRGRSKLTALAIAYSRFFLSDVLEVLETNQTAASVSGCYTNGVYGKFLSGAKNYQTPVMDLSPIYGATALANDQLKDPSCFSKLKFIKVAAATAVTNLDYTMIGQGNNQVFLSGSPNSNVDHYSIYIHHRFYWLHTKFASLLSSTPDYATPPTSANDLQAIFEAARLFVVMVAETIARDLVLQLGTLPKTTFWDFSLGIPPEFLLMSFIDRFDPTLYVYNDTIRADDGAAGSFCSLPTLNYSSTLYNIAMVSNADNITFSDTLAWVGYSSMYTLARNGGFLANATRCTSSWVGILNGNPYDPIAAVIQRGRDNVFPSCAAYRASAGLAPVTFSDFGNDAFSKTFAAQYGNDFSKVELSVCMLLDSDLRDRMMGSLISSVLNLQNTSAYCNGAQPNFDNSVLVNLPSYHPPTPGSPPTPGGPLSGTQLESIARSICRQSPKIDMRALALQRQLLLGQADTTVNLTQNNPPGGTDVDRFIVCTTANPFLGPSNKYVNPRQIVKEGQGNYCDWNVRDNTGGFLANAPKCGLTPLPTKPANSYRRCFCMSRDSCFDRGIYVNANSCSCDRGYLREGQANTFCERSSLPQTSHLADQFGSNTTTGGDGLICSSSYTNNPPSATASADNALAYCSATTCTFTEGHYSNGACNNAGNADLGRVGSALGRIVPANYPNGISYTVDPNANYASGFALTANPTPIAQNLLFRGMGKFLLDDVFSPSTTYFNESGLRTASDASNPAQFKNIATGWIDLSVVFPMISPYRNDIWLGGNLASYSNTVNDDTEKIMRTLWSQRYNMVYNQFASNAFCSQAPLCDPGLLGRCVRELVIAEFRAVVKEFLAEAKLLFPSPQLFASVNTSVAPVELAAAKLFDLHLAANTANPSCAALNTLNTDKLLNCIDSAHNVGLPTQRDLSSLGTTITSYVNTVKSLGLGSLNAYLAKLNVPPRVPYSSQSDNVLQDLHGSAAEYAFNFGILETILAQDSRADSANATCVLAGQGLSAANMPLFQSAVNSFLLAVPAQTLCLVLQALNTGNYNAITPTNLHPHMFRADPATGSCTG